MIWEIVAGAAALLSLNAAGLGMWNLTLYRRLPRAGSVPPISVLIPARDEEQRIEPTLAAVLANVGVELEIVVLDDDSSDRTAEIVRRRAAQDSRVRLETAPPLPAGWSGKQRACHILSGHARHDLMLFLDAEVRLAPDALARIAAAMERTGSDLLSGFPRELARSWAERLVIPMIHFLLLGFLPIWGMRRHASGAFAAGCGQLIAVRRAAYAAAGGHGAIRRSMHDGITLPRAFRQARRTTDLFDATDIAECRMYSGAREVWSGFKKNATEGMATPVALPIWTALLLGGQVTPFVLLAVAALTPLPSTAVWLACFGAAAALAFRLSLAIRFRQSLSGAVLHPVAVLAVLAIQWSALIDSVRGRPALWRGRSYEAS